jgi:hypothetical protein
MPAQSKISGRGRRADCSYAYWLLAEPANDVTVNKTIKLSGLAVVAGFFFAAALA